MKRKSLYLGAALLGLVATGSMILTACSKTGRHEKDADISHYTCPMHPQIHKDHPGDCPICGMDLVPVYSSPPSPSPESGEGVPKAGVRIRPDRQQLIGLKTVVASKGPAIHEIRTVGYVRRELQTFREGDPVWIDANLYPSETGLVKPGAEAIVTLPSGSNLQWPGRVRTVDPAIDPATRSVRAHIEVPMGGEKIRRHSYVNVLIKADLGEALTVPKSAVIDTGVRKIAFVVKDGERFESREIRTGPEAGDHIVVLEGIEAGETVVTKAAFFVDSESRLKEAVQ